ncbi:MAG: filamentous hemagglutinin N-terminal domain-containing protein [Cyanobacteria bacterium P01_H01_bin.21]
MGSKLSKVGLTWSMLSDQLLTTLVGVLVVSKFSSAAQAQITPDTSLPVNSAVPNGCTTCLITGGTVTDDNQTLFHSFQQFSIPTGGAALFQNDPALATIVTRVTGGNISDIDGAIAAQGDVDLFLINPNGIVFGPNAVLQVPGSFVASSADSVVFEDGSFFSAAAPNTPPLLTVSTPVGLQLGTTPGAIRVEGPGNFPPTLPGLFVSPGHTLALVGGDVTVSGGTVSAPSGRLEIGSAAQGTVGLISLEDGAVDGFALNYENPQAFEAIPQAFRAIPQAFGAIVLREGALVNTSGRGAGAMTLQGQTVAVEDGSQILALTLGNLPGGNVNINATDSVTVEGASADNRIISRISTNTFGDGMGGDLVINTRQFSVRDRGLITASTGIGANGDGGNIVLRATESIELTGSGFATLQAIFLDVLRNNLGVTTVESGVLTGSGGSGASGQIIIDTARLQLRDGAFISTTTIGDGTGGDAFIDATESVEIIGSIVLTGTLQNTTQDAGDLTLNTQRLSIRDGGLLQAFTLGSGDGGNLVVNATESVELLNTPVRAVIPTGIFANSIFGTGAGGDIEVNTQDLTVGGGARIGNRTGAFFGGFGLVRAGGPAGNIVLNVDGTTAIVGVSPDGVFESGSDTSSLSGAPAGNVELNTGNLFIRDGANISTTTFSDGPGGTLIVNVADVLELSGTGTVQNASGPVELPSSLVSSSGRADFPGEVGDGTAGALQVTANELTIRDGAAISLASLGDGDAGTLDVSANQIQLVDGTINASTESGAGGNVTLQAPVLLLTDSSSINTNAQNTDGGNIDIDTVFLIALDNSDITANATQGRGGQVSITAQSILGTTFRETLTPDSDITATSELGPEFSGLVELNTPELEPDSGLVELPTTVNDLTNQIVAGCPADNNNRFVVGGQNGLPTNPAQRLESSGGWQDWRFLNDVSPAAATADSNLSEPEQTAMSADAQPIREANYAQVNESGQTMFISSSSDIPSLSTQHDGSSDCATNRYHSQ